MSPDQVTPLYNYGREYTPASPRQDNEVFLCTKDLSLNTRNLTTRRWTS
jgi:hypothetical protein